jgi:molybdopterin-guanine dinucleotide biosynthesis protein A
LDVSCIVLAGGKSTRLGRNKIAEVIGKSSLLERVVSSLAFLNADIIIVTAKDSSLPQLADYTGIKIINDIYPEKGSIGGIYSGLKASRSQTNLVVACDMPFLNLNLLRYMLEISAGYDVVVPRINRIIFEPLHAVYSKNCISPLERLIKADVFRIIELFRLVKVKYVENMEIDRFDPSHLSFFNVNTEEDLFVGRELARKEDV